jgi:hypothetical protein
MASSSSVPEITVRKPTSEEIIKVVILFTHFILSIYPIINLSY